VEQTKYNYVLVPRNYLSEAMGDLTFAAQRLALIIGIRRRRTALNNKREETMPLKEILFYSGIRTRNIFWAKESLKKALEDLIGAGLLIEYGFTTGAQGRAAVKLVF
jgi:hypothetical protein